MTKKQPAKTPNNQKPLQTVTFVSAGSTTMPNSETLPKNQTKPAKTFDQRNYAGLETRHNQNWITPPKPTKFAKHNLPETMLEKDKPIWSAYKANREHSRRKETKPK